MHSLSTLISHLQSGLVLAKTFKVEAAKDKDTTTTGPGSPIRIYVGYSGIAGAGSLSKLETPVDGEELLSDFTQFTIIQFECDTDDVPVVWKALYAAMSYYNPINSIEADYSGYTYDSGGAKGIVNGRYSWQDVWKLSFSFQA